MPLIKSSLMMIHSGGPMKSLPRTTPTPASLSVDAISEGILEVLIFAPSQAQ